ncbi:serine/threonine protein kinase [Loa loa]|nr:serine/threonine protein kinase [Loa loa]EFO26513.2 serine/threonine protein kinase [Loa loa]
MVERSAGTKTRRLLSMKARSLPPIDETADPLTLFQRHISQLHEIATECELFELAKPSLTKLLTLCKHETYRNNDRCFRIFLLAMKFLSDTNALKMFSAFYDNKIFTRLADFYICWARRCDDNHSFVRAILIKAEKMNARPKCAISIRKRSSAFP